MNIEQYRNHCIAKKGVTEEFPFGETTLVYKVMGKMFTLADIELFESINLKVDPEQGAALREQYTAVQPGYHMNKKHWITVIMDGSVPDKFIRQWIDDSYQLVVSGLTKKQQAELLLL
ncbi:MAG TPA: MmcQ/YjbR family DNA-binding protein [Ohtaekwangia sp.]|uniref:MmcQ/YjbR family DNA-binding protein n=1 Tax=Ohtaekwangia sp. TaxID=2066019 RepID=UPI002F9400B1